MPFVVLADDSLKAALAKIEKNKHKIVYVVDEKNHLLGCLADGDYRRWSIKQEMVDLRTPVNQVFNDRCFSMPLESRTAEIQLQLKKRRSSIPLVDNAGHLVAIAEDSVRFLTIAQRRISAEDQAFVIAEIGNNHQGDLALAKYLIDAAVNAGVDCVKFQMRSMDELYNSNGIHTEDLGSQYTLDLLSKYQLSDDELFEAFDYCLKKNVTPLCTPWDLVSLRKLEEYGIQAYKVASADFTNFQLLAAIAETGKPMICSTGMSTEDEIRETVAFLENRKAQFILLHCNSTYPTPYKDVNLTYLKRLESLCNWVVGYSGHERGWSVPIAAVALGAKVIEKHITTDRSLEGNDHKVSLLPEELTSMVREIRNVEQAMGDDAPRDLTQGEMINREVLAKSLVAKQDMEPGTVISADSVTVKAPGKGLQPNRISELIGKKTYRRIKAGDVFYEADILGGFSKKSIYQFSRPYGIPIRYHDFKNLTSEVKLDFVEFHLSYHDLNMNVSDYLEHNSDLRFAVHAPELFEHDHLLDLASDNEHYRARSIREMQRVIKHTNQLKQYFPSTELPIVVANVGGWNTKGFLSKADVARKYDVLYNSLQQLDLSGIQLAIQTMPPFPWHFGGQSHHNLFVRADEIVEFCQRSLLKVCLDVSHTMMACNFYKDDFYDFVRKVAPYVVHMHIVDAKGLDGEGIQIGHGDVDFRKLGKILQQDLPSTPFIPEIWQGHKNNGEGFWKALAYLENQFAA
ncbi:N-acetylneuraminate synthase family protein [Bowmanella dokdonensis]|nr:N-acetylneuraminate synthase family protein [Bowmanella dokdonensis]